MKIKSLARVLPALLVLTAVTATAKQPERPVVKYTVDLYDTLRSRLIPLSVSAPQKTNSRTGVVLFSHGYGKNIGKSYQAYTYLTDALAAAGYYVVSIQHELPDDEPLSMEGDLYATRLPNWERGVENIRFVLNTFRQLRPDLDWTDITLIGHSNGGDMTMLFASRYPELATRAVSLDNRRMPLPRTRTPRISTLRGCDYPADAGVLPGEDEQKQLGIRVIRYPDIRHGDMDNKGTELQHRQICQDVLQQLTH